MYTDLKIQNFRGFKNIEIKGIKRINLIAGMNDSGKTSLLEAIFLNAGKNINLIFSINKFRGINRITLNTKSERPWNSIFYNTNFNNKVIISGNWNSNKRIIEISAGSSNIEINAKSSKIKEYKSNYNSISEYPEITPTVNISELDPAQILRLKYSEKNKTETYDLIIDSNGITSSRLPSPSFPAYFYGCNLQTTFEDAELFGKLDVLNEIDNITKILQIIEPRLKRLTIVVLNGEPIIHGDVGLGKLLPLPFMGGGLCRLMSIILRISNAKGGVVLIDEIENGFHFSINAKIWQAIDEVSKKYNVQIFATTHSYECINYAYDVFSRGNKDDFAFFRLDRIDEKIIAKLFDIKMLKYALETETEVR